MTPNDSVDVPTSVPALSVRIRRVVGALLCAVALVVSAGVFPESTVRADEKDPAEERIQKQLDDLEKALKVAYAAKDEDGLYDVLRICSKVNRREPVEFLMQHAKRVFNQPESYDWYWAIIDSVAQFQMPVAMSEIGDQIVGRRARAPMNRDLLLALRNNRSKYVNRVIRRVLDKGAPDQKLAAIDIAAQIPVRRTVDVLMAHLAKLEEKKSSRGTVEYERVITALQALTFQEYGNRYELWERYWKQARKQGLRVIRAKELMEGQTRSASNLDPVRDSEFERLKQIPEGKVLVIYGETSKTGVDTNNDDISGVLKGLGIPHDTIGKDAFQEEGHRIDQYVAIFLNCTQYHSFCQSPGHQGGGAVGNRLRRCLGEAPHDTFQGAMKPPGQEKLKDWVKAGGYLFTEDYVLGEILTNIFPKQVGLGPQVKTQQARIRPGKGQATHRFNRGVFTPPIDISEDNFDIDEEDDPDDDWDWVDEDDDDDGPPEWIEKYDPKVEDDNGDEAEEQGRKKTGGGTSVDPSEEEKELAEIEFRRIRHEWKIDDESNLIDLRSKKIDVLIHSTDLKKRHGHGAVAISFQHGKGNVLHCLSHFGKQESSTDEASIKNLLINYLLAATTKLR